MKQLHHLSAQPILRYDFQNVSSTIVPDTSFSGSIGVIKGHDRGGAMLKSESVFGTTLSTLFLKGGTHGGYLQLPDGILNNVNGVTISFYANVHSLEEFGTIFSFGTDNCFYLSILPDPDNSNAFLISPCVTKGGRSQEAALEQWISLSLNTWFHVAVTLDSNTPSSCIFYIDGQQMGNFFHRRMNCVNLCNETPCYIGTSSFSHELYPLSVADISLFSAPLDAQEISKLFTIENNTRFQLEIEELEKLFKEPLSDNIPLPAFGKFGTSLTWESLVPDLMSDRGEITRPDSQSSSKKGNIKGILTYQDITFDHLFSFVVLPLPEDIVLLQEDLNRLSIPFPKHLVEDIYLPSSGANGTQFNWVSNTPAFLSDKGHITRPSHAPQEISLTLTATFRAVQLQKEFLFTLYPVYGQKKTQMAFHPLSKQEKSAIPFPRKVKPIPIEQISFKDTSLLMGNYQRCLDYLLFLDSDRMLYNFRKAYGEDTQNALPLGGWEEPTGLLRGHSTGHFLSALAFAFSSTKDTRYLDKINYLVDELRKLQALCKGKPEHFDTSCTPLCASQSLWDHNPSTWGEGFLSAYSPDQFALLEQLTPYATIWAPYYTLHKLLAGFLDCYTLAHNKTALACAEGIGLWVYKRLSVVPAELRSQMWSMYIAGEYGGMNESLAVLSRLTGKKEYMDAAEMFDNPKVFQGLIENRDTITGIHANQHIPQIVGTMEEYRCTDDLDYYYIARNFWQLVTSHYAYSIGGVGRGENFKEPDILAGNIESDRNCETCAAYNLLKLTGHLYTYEPTEGSYMDYYERTVLNQIAASQNPIVRPNSKHGVTYMLPIGPGAKRGYSSDYDDFTCCHGTGMENHVRYCEQIYHMDERNASVFVNLFFSSTVSLSDTMSLVQNADFPFEQSRITIKGNGTWKIYIRIPYWCKNEFAIEYNSVLQPTHNLENSYYTLEKSFSDGDEILIHLPHKLHLCFTPDDLEKMPVASIMYGPLVMTALSNSQEFITLNLPPVLEEAFELRKLPSPVLWYDDLKFIPMYEAHNMNYHTYFRINLL